MNSDYTFIRQLFDKARFENALRQLLEKAKVEEENEWFIPLYIHDEIIIEVPKTLLLEFKDENKIHSNK